MPAGIGDFFKEPFDPEGVNLAEELAAGWVKDRPGVSQISQYLPGGRDLTVPELNDLNAMLGHHYGFNALIDFFGRPFQDDPLTAATPIDRGNLHWVMPHKPGETRSYLRVGVPRELAMSTDDPRIVALTQTSFQYREEREAEALAGKFRRGTGASSYIVSSGTRPKLDSIKRLMKQRQHYLEEDGTRVIFDLETASLFPEHGIRQLSYRVTNAAGDLVGSPKTLDFKNAIMGLGHYTGPAGEFVAGAAEIAADDMPEHLIDFFETAGRSRYLVGQNAMFDVGMLAEIRKSPLYQRGEQLLRETEESNLSGLTGHDALAVRLKRGFDDFHAKAFSEDFVDTAAHARILMSEVDQVRLAVAPEILKRGEAKLFSIENLILQSSFLQDIVETGVASRAEVHARLTGQGLHAAETDTWFTDMLSRLQKKVYVGGAGGKLEDGRSILRTQKLDAAALSMIYGEVLNDDQALAIRGTIASGRAITPFTHLPVSQLGDLFDETTRKGILTPEEWEKLKAGDINITPLQKMVLHTRDVGMARRVVHGQEAARSTGLFNQFLQDRGILTQEGKLSGRGQYPTAAEWKTTQKTLQEAGYAAPGLSFPERLLSTILGTSPSLVNEQLTSARSVLGEMTLTGSWIPSELGAFPAKKAARSVAIPLDTLRRMALDDAIDGTNLLQAFEGKGVQWLGMSPFQFRSGKKFGGRTVEDVALTVPGIISTDKKVAEGQIKRIRDWLELNQPGMTPKELTRIEQGLRATGATTGIQIATLGGAKGPTTAGTVMYNVLKHLGFDVDKARGGLYTPLKTAAMGAGIQTPRAGIETGAVHIRAADQLEDPKFQSDVLAGLQDSTALEATFESEIAGDTRFLSQVDPGKVGIRAATPHVATGGGGGFPEWYSKHISGTGVPMKALGVAAGAAVGYYLWKKHKKNTEANQVMAEMPYESGSFYTDYRQELGMAPKSNAMLASSRNRDPLSTASLPAYLDQNKSGHHQMGADKHSHLFGG